jgi:two-component system cell cycle response regulator
MQGAEQSPRGVTILIAEDDPMARNVLGMTLPKKFPQVRALLAANGQEGLELFQRHHPEIVLTDIAMPVMDGFALAGAISAQNPDTVIISISAHGGEEFRRRAAEAGIRCHVEKPLDLKALFSQLERYIGALG